MTGPNGVGKTNLLEALHVGSQGFSPRTRAEAQLVRFGEEAARVVLAGSEGGRVVSAVAVSAREPKQIRLNGATLASADELRARVSALAFLPDRLAIVKGGPIVRRAYFDRMLGRVFPARSQLPTAYGRALAQRNEALRRTRAGLSSRDAVEPWTAQVAEFGTELDRARAELVALVAPAFRANAELLGLEGGTIAYEARELSVEELDGRLERDLARGITGAGPHLRDVSITAAGRELRSFGSQGEQRAAVLALVLAESALVVERRGAPPLLLLDDVLSELDEARRAALLRALPSGGQTVVTATSEGALPSSADAPAVRVSVTPGEAVSA